MGGTGTSSSTLCSPRETGALLRALSFEQFARSPLNTRKIFYFNKDSCNLFYFLLIISLDKGLRKKRLSASFFKKI